MGEMIGAIAHQWRQPLATLGAMIQSIRMAWQRNCMDDSFLKRAEADAQKQINYMSETIEDFRNFFSPDKVAELFDLKGKIDDVVLLVSAQFANAGVVLQVIDNSPGCRLYVKGYPNEFKQSLLNLVGNAFDAIQDKVAQGSQPDAWLETNGQVTIVVSGEGNKAIIEVLDDGCGIPAENADKVFDPYFTTKSGDKGTGIGLYMTRLIIEESMGGSLSFESGPGGTEFRIELALDDSGEGDGNG
jgi:signal transduction histidine kinase